MHAGILERPLVSAARTNPRSGPGLVKFGVLPAQFLENRPPVRGAELVFWPAIRDDLLHPELVEFGMGGCRFLGTLAASPSDVRKKVHVFGPTNVHIIMLHVPAAAVLGRWPQWGIAALDLTCVWAAAVSGGGQASHGGGGGDTGVCKCDSGCANDST